MICTINSIDFVFLARSFVNKQLFVSFNMIPWFFFFSSIQNFEIISAKLHLVTHLNQKITSENHIKLFPRVSLFVKMFKLEAILAMFLHPQANRNFGEHYFPRVNQEYPILPIGRQRSYQTPSLCRTTRLKLLTNTKMCSFTMIKLV